MPFSRTSVLQSKIVLESHRTVKKNETLWSYACNGFSDIRPQIDPKPTQIENIENRSGATPVMDFICFVLEIEPDRDGKNRSGATPVVVSEPQKSYRNLDKITLQNYQSG